MKQTSRNILKTVVLATLMLYGHAFAQVLPAVGPNKVFIEQVGSHNTVTIQQVGTGNLVGGTASSDPSSSNYGTITGSNNTLTMTQTGDINKAQYNLLASDSNYTSTVLGSSNETKLTIGDLNNATNLRVNVTEIVTGDQNKLIQNIIGSDIISNITITGDQNEVNKNLLSSLGQTTLTVTGDNNKFDVEQTGIGGAAGHKLTQVINGDFNSIVTQQQGSNDTVVNIAVNGGHNTITVRTSNAAIVNPMTAVAR